MEPALVLNENQREAGCLGRARGAVLYSATTPMKSGHPGWSGSGGLVFPTARGMGWPSQGQGYSCRGSGASSSNCPSLRPPRPPGLPFKATECHLVGGGRGEKTQIRHRPGSSEPGCGLVQGVRRRELKPDGCLWPAPSREAARPCSTMGPLLRLALHLPLTLPGDLGLAPSQGINLAQDGGRWAGSPCEPRPMLSVLHTPAQSHMVGCNS